MLREEHTIKCNTDIRKLNEYVITVCMTYVYDMINIINLSLNKLLNC